MNLSDALWGVFEQTGHIGAYLLYKDYQRLEGEGKSFLKASLKEGDGEALDF